MTLHKNAWEWLSKNASIVEVEITEETYNDRKKQSWSTSKKFQYYEQIGNDYVLKDGTIVSVVVQCLVDSHGYSLERHALAIDENIIKATEWPEENV